MYNVNIKTVSETKSSIKSKSISHKIKKTDPSIKFKINNLSAGKHQYQK